MKITLLSTPLHTMLFIVSQRIMGVSAFANLCSRGGSSCIGTTTGNAFRTKDWTTFSSSSSPSLSSRSVSFTSTQEGSRTDNSNNNNNNNNNNTKKAKTPLVVCGPSGAGKGTLIHKYMQDYGGSQHFGFTVSHTTRSPRPGEVNGVHYHFVTKEYMKDSIQHGDFLEHAQVHGNYYGTSRQALQDVVQQHGKRCILDIDVQGVKRLKEMESETLQPKYIFIAPPSLDILKQRLKGRGTETLESLERRTANANAEMEYGMLMGNFDCIVVNDDLEQACHDFDKAIRSFYNDLE